jgi:uncharacterized membrane protein YhdT
MRNWHLLAPVFLLVTSVTSAIIKGNQAKKTGKKVGSAILLYVIGAAISALLLGRELLGDNVPEWVDWAFVTPIVALLILWLGIAIVRLKHYLQTAWWLNEWKKK